MAHIHSLALPLSCLLPLSALVHLIVLSIILSLRHTRSPFLMLLFHWLLHIPPEKHIIGNLFIQPPTSYFSCFPVCSYISRSLVVKAAIHVYSNVTSLPLLKNPILRHCTHICTDNQNMKDTNLLLEIMYSWCTGCSTSITCCCTAGHRGSFPQWPRC